MFIFNKKLKYSLFFFVFLMLIFFASLFFWHTAGALTGNYNKNTGESLNSSDWNNLDNDFVAKSGDTMQGALNMGNQQITNLASPVNDGDAVNKSTLNSAIAELISENTVIQDYSGSLKVYCGRTQPGATNWIEGSVWYVDVDISAANFTEGTHPYIFSSLGGFDKQWHSRGATSIFAENPVTLNNLDDKFRIYISDDSGANFANFLLKGWFINWCAFGR